MKDRAGAWLNILRLGLKQGGAPLSSVRSSKGQRYPHVTPSVLHCYSVGGPTLQGPQVSHRREFENSCTLGGGWSVWRAGCYAGVKIRRDISDCWPHGQLVIRVEWSQDRLCPWNEQLEQCFCLKKMGRGCVSWESKRVLILLY